MAVVLEELGHALFPGPMLPTLLVSAALARHEDTAVRRGAAPGVGGRHRHRGRGAGLAGPAVGGRADGAVSISGSARPVLGLPTARLVLVPLDRDGVQWWLLDRDALGDR